MQKKIVKASPAAFGHLMLEFEDGTKQIVQVAGFRLMRFVVAAMAPRMVTKHVTSGVQTGALRKKA